MKQRTYAQNEIWIMCESRLQNPAAPRKAGRPRGRGSLATLWTLARVPARRRITCRAARRFVQPRGAAAPAERLMEGTKISPSRPHALARRGQPPRLAHRSLPRLRNHTHTLQASANSQRAPARSEQTGRPSVSPSLTHTSQTHRGVPNSGDWRELGAGLSGGLPVNVGTALEAPKRQESPSAR